MAASDSPIGSVAAPDDFAESNFSAKPAQNDPCRERVLCGNQIKESRRGNTAAKTDMHGNGERLSQFSQQQQPNPQGVLDSTSQSASFGQQQHSTPVGQDGFSFSPEQLKGPVVIEIFCGSARVTAALKELGLRDSFGIDHALDKAVSEAKRLDLTKSADQEILMQWLKSPLVVGVFLAPPCGTCSKARNIQLRDEKGRKIPGPIPLRSETWPEGFPGLRDKDRARVSAANLLYEFVGQVVTVADSLGLMVVVENPRSSIFWLTRFWKNIGVQMGYTAHQACSYGGERPKWTVLAWNHPAFATINLCCPGESQHHNHKPWGLVHSDNGNHFSTSEETAYPRGLAHTIAKVFAAVLCQHGWSPPSEQWTGKEVNLQSMRAAATAQPKAAKMPPIVREHKSVILVKGAHAALAEVPIGPMQRLKDPWKIPLSCSASVAEIPAGAQLLRQTPLRLSGGIISGKLESMGSEQFEQAWGVPFDPEEFITEAVQRGHPKLFSRLVPDVLQKAIEKNFGKGSVQGLPAARASWFSKWTARAKQLMEEEVALKATLPSHAAHILEPKRMLLFKEILEDTGYPDVGAFEELLHGTELVGEVKPFGIFEKAFRPADITTEQLLSAPKSTRVLNFYKCASSGDAEIDEVVYSKTLEEVELGWARGPFDLSELPNDAVVSRRFGLKQSTKIRLIDDLSSSNVNQTVQTAESPKPHSVDFIAAMLLEVLKHNKNVQLKGRSFDLKSAYKQLAISKGSLSCAFVAVFNPKKRRAELFQLLAAPFGATRSVYSFLRISNAIWYIGVKALSIIWSCFFDDYVSFCREEHVNNTGVAVELLFKLLGWKFAEEGDKAESFATEFGALGIRIILDESTTGVVKFTNTTKRSEELMSTIDAILSKGSMTLVEAQRLRGRMQFMDGQLFGRLGKLCMREVTNHTLTPGVTRLCKRTSDALRRFAIFLEHAEPRKLHLSSDTVWYIYTDACFEPTSIDWKCGLGGVLVNPLGQIEAFFSVSLTDDQMKLLGYGEKKTIIFEAELLAMVVAFAEWRDLIAARSLLCFIDNNSARDVAISGSGRNATANFLVESLLKLEMATSTTPWYSRVPTPSNIADGPSRGEILDLVAGGVKNVCVQKTLAEILVVLTEAADKRGHFI